MERVEMQGDASPHPDDKAVDLFAAAMKKKLAEARAKGRGGWDGGEDLQQRLSDMLRDHVAKGDPRDVANFACFLWNRGESIAPAATPQTRLVEVVNFLCGVGELDGRKLGDEPPYDIAGRCQPFWWREHLREATAPFIAAQQEKEWHSTSTSYTAGPDETHTRPMPATLAAPAPPPAESEYAKAFQDQLDTGAGFMLDGKRIAPDRVFVMTPSPAEQASGELQARLAEANQHLIGSAKHHAAIEEAIAALSQRPVVGSVTAEQVAAAAHAYCKDLNIVGPDDWHIRGMWAALEAAALAPQQPQKGEG